MSTEDIQPNIPNATERVPNFKSPSQREEPRQGMEKIAQDMEAVVADIEDISDEDLEKQMAEANAEIEEKDIGTLKEVQSEPGVQAEVSAELSPAEEAAKQYEAAIAEADEFADSLPGADSAKPIARKEIAEERKTMRQVDAIQAPIERQKRRDATMRHTERVILNEELKDEQTAQIAETGKKLNPAELKDLDLDDKVELLAEYKAEADKLEARLQKLNTVEKKSNIIVRTFSKILNKVRGTENRLQSKLNKLQTDITYLNGEGNFSEDTPDYYPEKTRTDQARAEAAEGPSPSVQEMMIEYFPPEDYHQKAQELAERLNYVQQELKAEENALRDNYDQEYIDDLKAEIKDIWSVVDELSDPNNDEQAKWTESFNQKLEQLNAQKGKTAKVKTPEEENVKGRIIPDQPKPTPMWQFLAGKENMMHPPEPEPKKEQDKTIAALILKYEKVSQAQKLADILLTAKIQLLKERTRTEKYYNKESVEHLENTVSKLTQAAGELAAKDSDWLAAYQEAIDQGIDRELKKEKKNVIKSRLEQATKRYAKPEATKKEKEISKQEMQGLNKQYSELEQSVWQDELTDIRDTFFGKGLSDLMIIAEKTNDNFHDYRIEAINEQLAKLNPKEQRAYHDYLNQERKKQQPNAA
ncbi:MAG: hypothetical protein ABH835_04600 [Patescibacteria group bacterium]